MMMGTMGAGMLWGALLGSLLLLGFAYLIWVAAIKETGAVKLTGQVIAIVIAAAALIILLYGGIYRGAICKYPVREKPAYTPRLRMDRQQMHPMMDKMNQMDSTDKNGQ